MQPGQKYNFPWHYIATATSLTRLSYTKVDKFAAIRSVFATKNSINAFAAEAPQRTRPGELSDTSSPLWRVHVTVASLS